MATKNIPILLSDCCWCYYYYYYYYCCCYCYYYYYYYATVVKQLSVKVKAASSKNISDVRPLALPAVVGVECTAEYM
ncbi:hypothetical protein E2C01_097898 [Portunus trituberculatus]|uniref:Uncharacterized protein n=1 Tax=Portunus trituberculatus TaxID=210409 RepID=A0A5B7JZU4_PORTR|nr:hypothetical protein [Portunus trituberculatus]